MTYGCQLTTKNAAYCRKCGAYKTEADLYQGTRGEQRCVLCHNQVKLKPTPCRQLYDKRRRHHRNA